MYKTVIYSYLATRRNQPLQVFALLALKYVWVSGFSWFFIDFTQPIPWPVDSIICNVHIHICVCLSMCLFAPLLSALNKMLITQFKTQNIDQLRYYSNFVSGLLP